MKQLVLLYWGCVFLMYLSQVYYPTEDQLEGRQTGKRHFMLRHADIFMIIVIAWMTCFSFLRTSYNDTCSWESQLRHFEKCAACLRNSLPKRPMSAVHISALSKHLALPVRFLWRCFSTSQMPWRLTLLI